jgi:uncharacterized membrane protein
MTGKYYYTIGGLLTGAALVATAVVYPQLPSTVPIHWDINNQPNGYGPKWVMFVTGPGIMVGVMLLMRLLPWLSPKQFEVNSFRSTYHQIMLMIVGLMGYVHAVALAAASGHRVNIGRAILGGICLSFVFMGNVMGKIRRNFYIGVKTPWALANERVWNATHRFAAKTMVGGGMAGLALTVAGLNFWAPFVILLTGALVPVVYSLYFYKQLERRGEL